MTSVESTVQKKLGIKWVDAKNLVHQATVACEISSGIPSDRTEEVINEACEIFADLDEAEQKRMRLPEPSNGGTGGIGEESDWRQKAREQAERRDAEWQAKESAVANSAAVQDRLRNAGVAEEEVQGTRVVSIRKVGQETGPVDDEPPAEDKTPTVRMRTHTCFCVIQ